MAEPKIALVTGASGVIGHAICAGLVSRELAVVMVGRNRERMSQARARLLRDSPTASIGIETVDVSRAAEVSSFASRWQGRLDVLVNNAAIAPPTRTETPEGIEMQLATNVLGYVWMMRYFEPILRSSAPARVVNVASYWAGDLRLDDLQFQRRPYDNDTAYRQSKQADRMLTVAFAGKWDPATITVNSCHPGDASSTLSRALGYGGADTPEQAADTPVWLASDAAVAGVTGKYFANREPRRCQFAGDAAAIAALDAICSRFD